MASNATIFLSCLCIQKKCVRVTDGDTGRPWTTVSLVFGGYGQSAEMNIRIINRNSAPLAIQTITAVLAVVCADLLVHIISQRPDRFLAICDMSDHVLHWTILSQARDLVDVGGE